MSKENLEIVRAALNAFNEGDFDKSVANLAPEFEYIPTGTIPGSEACTSDARGGSRPGVVLGEFDGVSH